jgi:hypothetical protein
MTRGLFCCLAIVLAGNVSAAGGGIGVLHFDAVAIAPRDVGDSLVVRGVLFPSSWDPPLPLDFADLQHTIVYAPPLTGIGGAVDFYGTARLSIYSDSLASGTRADPALPATYTDGDCILRATVHEFSHSNFGSPGTAGGHFTLDGGSRLQEVGIPPCILAVGWTNSDPDLPPGYDETWIGDLYPLIDAVESRSWSTIKALFREPQPARR